jgi:hypothetical protein
MRHCDRLDTSYGRSEHSDRARGLDCPLGYILLRMSLRNRLYRISLCCILGALLAVGVVAQSTHYSVKLVPDFERHVLLGDETIEFQSDAGEVEWQKQAGLHIVGSTVAKGAVNGGRTVGDRARAFRRQTQCPVQI